VVDSMRSIDMSSVDSVGVWCGGTATDTMPDFGNAAATKWFRTQDLSTVISTMGKDSIVIINAQFNSGTIKTVWCAVILKGKNGRYSQIVKASFSVGADRPANPIALSAVAQSASRIRLSWPPVSVVDGIRVVYRADTVVPMNNYYFDTTRYFVASPAPTDTTILLSGLQEKTHYYFGAQIYKGGLWSVVTQNSSANVQTPGAGPKLGVNTLKLDSLGFDPSTDQIKVFWKAAGSSASDSLQVGISYSTTGFPDSTQAALVQQVVPVINAIGTSTAIKIPNLQFNTRYYVSLWESRVDGVWAAPTDSSQDSLTTPGYNWQSVTYFTKVGGDTAFAFQQQHQAHDRFGDRRE